MCSHSAVTPDGWVPPPRCALSGPGRQTQNQEKRSALPSHDVPQERLTSTQRGWEPLAGRVAGRGRRGAAWERGRGEVTWVCSQAESFRWNLQRSPPPPPRPARRRATATCSGDRPLCGPADRRLTWGGGGPAGRHRLPGGTRCQPLLAPQGTTVPPGLLQGPGCPPGKTPSSPLPCPPLLRPPARGESLCDPE